MENSQLPKKLAKFIKPGSVFIFSKTYCGYCLKAKNLLKTLEVNFNSIELDETDLENDDAFLNDLDKHSGINTYPKIYIGVNCVGGFTDLNKLFKNNQLFKKLNEENVKYKGSSEIKF
jgi:glutaredoxin 3